MTNENENEVSLHEQNTPWRVLWREQFHEQRESLSSREDAEGGFNPGIIMSFLQSCPFDLDHIDAFALAILIITVAAQIHGSIEVLNNQRFWIRFIQSDDFGFLILGRCWTCVKGWTVMESWTCPRGLRRRASTRC